MMRVTRYKKLAEKLYHQKLPNGLDVYILPKPDFEKSFATFTTKYGAIDNDFEAPEGRVQVLDGIAHFLEHKMFEQASGEDVHQQFSKQGASSNAFTSSTKTAYLFSCTDKLEKNLETLLDYVQEPYFTDENVEKEKGIIAQELEMYNDNPDWRLYSNLLQSLYKYSPVRIDVGGSVESIYEITKEDLYQCYNTFYHPSNMLLFVVGPCSPARLMKFVENNQAKKNFPPATEIIRYMPREPDELAKDSIELELSVGVPKCLLGIKEKVAHLGKTGDDYLKQDLEMEIVLGALFGEGSEFYQTLYKKRLIDDGFGASYTLEPEYGFTLIGGNTSKPDKLVKALKNTLPQLVSKGIDKDDFQRLRKKEIGSILHALNSQKWIANQFTSYKFRKADLFNIIPILESLQLEDVNRRMREHFDLNCMAVSIVRPFGAGEDE